MTSKVSIIIIIAMYELNTNTSPKIDTVHLATETNDSEYYYDSKLFSY